MVLALAVSALFALPAPPAAAAPEITSVNPSSLQLQAGGEEKVVSIGLKTNGVGPETVRISLSGLPQGVSCERCNETVNLLPGMERTHNLRLRASGNAPSASTQVTVLVSADSGDAPPKQFALTVVGKPQEKPTVKSISGQVVNSRTGEPIEDAIVAITDPDGHHYSTRTNQDGRYSFKGSQENPITPGAIKIGAMKDDVASSIQTINVGNGGSATLRIAIQLPEPTPSASPSESAEPTPSETAEATESAEAFTPLPRSDDADEGGSGIGSLLLILVGGLLVALGVGAIVLLLMRRKDGADEEGDDEEAAAAGRGHVPGSQGRYGGMDDPTRVTGGMGATPTVVTSPALSDAPTAMLDRRALADEEFPDPYGAPLPPQPRPSSPGYGGEPGWDRPYDSAPTQPGYGSGGYGNAPSSGGGGYGAPPTSGGTYGSGPTSGGGGYGSRPGGEYGDGPAGSYGPSPTSGGAYGGPERGYGESGQFGPGYGYDGSGGGYEDRYDQPGGRYDQPGGGYGERRHDQPRYDEPTGRYGDAGGRYGESNPYDDQPTYGQSAGRGYSDGGYGSDHGYGGPGGGGGDYSGGYGSRSYDERDSYGPSGYDQHGGGYDTRGGYGEQHGGYGRSDYDRVPEQRGYPGYGQDPGGYYAGSQDRTQQSSRSERRSLGWLDD